MESLNEQATPQIVRTAGPLFLGYIFNWGLFGVLSVQMYNYHIMFTNDLLPIKILVYSVFILEVIQTGTFTVTGYDTFATRYGDPSALLQLGIGWMAMPMLTALVEFMTHLFYAYRIKVLTGSPYIPGIVIILTFLQLTAMIGVTVQLHKTYDILDYFRKTGYIFSGIWECSSALCDIMITVCMMCYLIQRGAKMERTNVIISRIIRLVVGTGALTAAVAILTLFFTFVPRYGRYYTTTGAIISKVYSNSMFVLLNSRVRHRQESMGSGQEMQFMSVTTSDKNTTTRNSHHQPRDVHQPKGGEPDMESGEVRVYRIGEEPSTTTTTLDTSAKYAMKIIEEEVEVDNHSLSDV